MGPGAGWGSGWMEGEGRQGRGLAGGGQSSGEGLGHERARHGVQSEPRATLAQDLLAAPSAGRL